MLDELHHRVEGERVREAILSLPVVDPDQLVVAAFPREGKKKVSDTGGQNHLPGQRWNYSLVLQSG